jgi:acetolactate decarboxylase
LFQYSTLGSLMAGVFDGEMTFAELEKHGDFGLGTFNELDGEMVEIDDLVYQIKSDGVAYLGDDALKTPFSVVTHFEADQTVSFTEPIDCEQLKAQLDSLLPTENIPYAIKISGTFNTMQTRSVPRQEKPYKTLLEVLETQPMFEFQAVEGVMLGFRLPSYMEVVNAPGYHFHFINADRTAGGHVLDCQVQNVVIEIDHTDEWHVVLPGDDAFYQVELSTEEYQ